MNKQVYTITLIIIISSIVGLEIVDSFFKYNIGINYLLNDLLFVAGAIILFYGWKFRIFSFLFALGLIKLNIGLLNNPLLKPGCITSHLALDLQLIKLILSIVSLVIIAAGFQNKINLGHWKDEIVISETKLLGYFLLSSIAVQAIVRSIP